MKSKLLVDEVKKIVANAVNKGQEDTIPWKSLFEFRLNSDGAWVGINLDGSESDVKLAIVATKLN